MDKSNPGVTPAARRYVFRTLAFMGGYVAIILAVSSNAFDNIRNTPAAWALAVIVSAPVIGQIWATLALMRESDEFVRAVTAKRFIAATGLTMAAATVWGFGETFAGAPHVSTWLIYPVFWAAFGCISPFIRASN
jgi:putative oxidoreductase